MQWPGAIKIREVGPRDGLQNETTFVPTAIKIELIKSLVQAGVNNIEATSFVHPRAVPQLSDAELVLAGLGATVNNVVISALVANMKGLQRALAAGIQEVMVVISASESHNKANVQMPVQKSLQVVKEMGLAVSGSSTKVRGAVATAFGCPVQGSISCRQVGVVVEGMLTAGIKAITLADTAGMGHPRQVYNLVRELSHRYPEADWALHFHDNQGLALANIIAGIQAGVTTLESSVGGLGGCPFIPDAPGNVATEDVVFMLNQMGIETAIDLKGILHCKHMLEKALGRTLP